MNPSHGSVARPRIPVVVIGGFLGAGKTTLLNRLLARGGRRLAVLINDFGSINIDAALADTGDNRRIELSNGCVCCQIGDDLSAALIEVLGAPSPPQAIVVEASGVSDPWKIAQVALADPMLALGTVLVLVDAAQVRTTAADPLLNDSVLRQLRAADLLVVNKTDLLPPEARPGLDGWLEQAAPGIPRIFTTDGEVPDALIWDPDPRAVDAAPSRAPRDQALPGMHCLMSDCRDSACRHPLLAGAGHGLQFEAWSWEMPSSRQTPSPRQAPCILSAPHLRTLLRAMPGGVLRLKGLVRTDEHALAEMQFAGQHGSLRAARGDQAGSTPVGHRIVAIGLRGRLPTEALQAAFDAACCPRPATSP